MKPGRPSGSLVLAAGQTCRLRRRLTPSGRSGAPLFVVAPAV